MTSTTQGPAAKRAYQGYYAETPQDDSFLTSVAKGTPCGEYMRRYWQPFLMSSELGELPIAVRLLGEDLVVFRDRSGNAGLLHKHCIHRGASLEFGIPGERGLRCSYHGWLFDVDGSILETPAEPETSKIRQNFCQGAYPVREQHGLVFAYMGPPEEIPDFPVYDTLSYPLDNNPVPFRLNLPCNWLQIVENAADPIHNAYLHAIVAGEQFSAAFKVPPHLDFPDTPLGFLSMATRRVGDYIFVRSSDIILPNVGQFPNGSNMVQREDFAVRPYVTRWAVPVDDHNSFYIGVAHLNSYNGATMDMNPDLYGLDRIPFVGQTNDRPYEERQMEPGDYDAVVSQGKVANRKAEHLGVQDRGVVKLRRMLTREIKDLQSGKPARRPEMRGGKVRTFVHETVVRAPEGNVLMPGGDDLEKFGLESAMVYVEAAGLPPQEREAVAARKIHELLAALARRAA